MKSRKFLILNYNKPEHTLNRVRSVLRAK